MNWDLWRSHGSLDLSLLFTVIVGRNFVSCICILKPKNLTKKLKSKSLFVLKKPRFFQPWLQGNRVNRSLCSTRNRVSK